MENSWFPFHPSSCFLLLFCFEFQLWLKWMWKARMTLMGFLVTVVERCHDLFYPPHLPGSWSVKPQVDVKAPPCWELTGSLPSTGEMWCASGCCVTRRLLWGGSLCWVQLRKRGSRTFHFCFWESLPELPLSPMVTRAVWCWHGNPTLSWPGFYERCALQAVSCRTSTRNQEVLEEVPTWKQGFN